MKKAPAEIIREYGPFPGVERVNGVTYDGRESLDRDRGSIERHRSRERKDASLDRCRRACGNGIRRPAPVSDRRGSHSEDRSGKRARPLIDPDAWGWWRLRASPGPKGRSGWASIGVGRSIKSTHGPAPILRTIACNRFVTGVTFVDGELWHGTWEGEESELRRLDPRSGEVLETLEMPPGIGVSGLESDGGDQFFCGGGASGKVRAVRRPKRA